MATLLPEPLVLREVDFTKKDWLDDYNNIWDEFTQEHKYVAFPVADGKAVYAVVSTNPLVLQHVEWGDSYAVHPALIRGLTLEDVEDRWEFRKLWSKSE